MTIVTRQPNAYETTFPTEFVTCRLEDGTSLRLFCKYQAGRSHEAHGARGNVSYECQVYSRMLEPRHLSRPKLYGVHQDPSTGQAWLLLEPLEDCLRLSKVDGHVGLPRAASWIGRFHRIQEPHVDDDSLQFLKRYDAEYYVGWSRRTREHTRELHDSYPWLPQLCDRFEDEVGPLLSGPPTIIHGEYTPNNILYRRRRIYPVDWESAAIASGELDLAILADRWGEQNFQLCRRAYCQERWPEGPPVDFDRKLGAARLYAQFRWLGETRDPPAHERAPWRFDELRQQAEEMQLI
ncbi:MAG: putative homoserine kinase type (protein kinase fold) [Chloroflexi bacterium]|nr:putative homoserine kinase type (protein kinase fold) [Chloroflexota bacterium]